MNTFDIKKISYIHSCRIVIDTIGDVGTSIILVA